MEVWKFIQKELNAGERLMLMVVVETRDSTPGKPGFKMAVSGSGGLSGSIGGGVMEFNMVNLARDFLTRGEVDPRVIRQVHEAGEGEDRSGMICSGMQLNLIYPLEPSHLEVIDAIVETSEMGQTGILDIQPGFMAFDHEPLTNTSIVWEMHTESEWRYTEHMGVKPVLYLFGGGHLSVPISRVFKMLGFKIVVFDDRPGLNTFSGNDAAHETHIIDYQHAASHITEGSNAYVAIMTASHQIDHMILRQMLPKKLKYLGMIGSRKKISAIFESLRSEGIAEELLNRVDSPMGIDINSQTVEEIAISIAAKAIQVKNENGKHKAG